MKKKILLVFGTRPEAIKMAPLVKAFEQNRREFTVRVCVTAQHRQMLDEVLRLFAITPDFDLNIMQEGQSLFHITSAALCRMEEVLTKERPDLVLVHGDTTTTFAATLAAFYRQIPVGHVEAGLRSYNRQQPFPEEANRLLTDALAEIYFAPTTTSKKALLRENVPAKKIFITGNTVIDALHMVLAQRRQFRNPALRAAFSGKRQKRTILVTAHRRENFGKPLEAVFTALRCAAQKYNDVQIIYPVHLNPNVREPAQRILGRQENILLLPPVDYAEMALIMDRSYMVVTDSGGLQEEAPSLGKPVLVLRKVTERPEAVTAGTVRIVGTDEQNVFRQICRVLDDGAAYRRMARAVNPYGDGRAAARTVAAVRYFFGMTPSRPKEFSVKR